MQKITLKLTALIIITSFLYACGGNEVETTEEEIITEEIADEDYIDKVDYLLPSPLQIAELFKSAGLTYIGDLTSSKDKV